MTKSARVFISALVALGCLSGCKARQIQAPQNQLAGDTSGQHSSPLDQVDPNTLRGYNSDVEDPPFRYQPEPDENVLYVKQKLFQMQIADIYYSFKKYEDRTIVVQGMYAELPIGDQEAVPTIYRRGKGCCGNDGWGGFLLKFPDDIKERPGKNDWIEIVGRPFLESQGYYYNLYLEVKEIKVLDERGAEFVHQ
ncbi:MAG: hypothetical protein Q4P72_02040 [Eubacteriales bacterium]|nr:hypothetical protein [Eubacteriales bacterium]